MKNRKRWLSVILSVVLTIAMCVTTAMAVGADDGAKPTITVETKTGTFNVDDEVELDVSISNNPGFAGFSFGVVYDAEKLQLTEIGKGSFDGMHTPNPEKNTVVFANTTDSANDGLMFTLKFKVIAGCSDGAKVSVEKNEIKNVAGKEIATLIVSGGLNVTPGTPSNPTPGGTPSNPTPGGTPSNPTPGGGSTGGGETGGGSTGGSVIIITPETSSPLFLSGANQVVAPGSAATFRIDKEFKDLQSVAVDGVTLDKSNYAAWSGSTYIKLLPSYTKTLSAGTHTLSAYFSGATAVTTFTISADGVKNPSTGANDVVGVAVAMAVISLLGASAVICKK